MVVRAAATGGGRNVLIGAWGSSQRGCRLAIERMRFALGVDDDLAPFHAALPLRPADRGARAADAVAAPAAAAGALRGARLGDLRAADRVRARGRDRAADRARARTLVAGAPAPPLRDLPSAGGARRRRAGAARVLRPLRRPRARAAPRRARGRARADRPRAAPTTSARGGACGRFPGSAAGPSSAWRCTARGASTRSRPAICRCASSSGGCAAATRRRAPRRTRSARSSRPTASGPGSPRSTRCDLSGPSLPLPSPRRARAGTRR